MPTLIMAACQGKTKSRILSLHCRAFARAATMLLIKSFHLIFMVAWFAGLFYLPRLFVYHCETIDDAGYARFRVMERKLFAIASIGIAGTVVFGVWLWLGYWPIRTGWIWAKAV